MTWLHLLENKMLSKDKHVLVGPFYFLLIMFSGSDGSSPSGSISDPDDSAEISATEVISAASSVQISAST